MKHLSRLDIEAIAEKYITAYMELPEVQDKLYDLTEAEDCPFVLWIGSRRLIKRKTFDEYIEKMYSI